VADAAGSLSTPTTPAAVRARLRLRLPVPWLAHKEEEDMVVVAAVSSL
jgi:hypothetical protein